jgi:hypothetical protein
MISHIQGKQHLTLMGIHKSLAHKGELKKGGGGVKGGGKDKVERTSEGFVDLVAFRPMNVTGCAEGPSRLEGPRPLATNSPTVECLFWIKGYNLGEGCIKQEKETFIQEGKTPSPHRGSPRSLQRLSS